MSPVVSTWFVLAVRHTIPTRPVLLPPSVRSTLPARAGFATGAVLFAPPLVTVGLPVAAATGAALTLVPSCLVAPGPVGAVTLLTLGPPIPLGTLTGAMSARAAAATLVPAFTAEPTATVVLSSGPSLTSPAVFAAVLTPAVPRRFVPAILVASPRSSGLAVVL